MLRCIFCSDLHTHWMCGSVFRRSSQVSKRIVWEKSKSYSNFSLHVRSRVIGLQVRLQWTISMSSTELETKKERHTLREWASNIRLEYFIYFNLMKKRVHDSIARNKLIDFASLSLNTWFVVPHLFHTHEFNSLNLHYTRSVCCMHMNVIWCGYFTHILQIVILASEQFRSRTFWFYRGFSDKESRSEKRIRIKQNDTVYLWPTSKRG